MADIIVIDGGLGEIRTAVLGPAGLVELVYDRPWEAVRDNDIFLARVSKIPSGGDGAFLSLGGNLEAYLPLRRSRSRPAEGDLIPVRLRVGARHNKRIVARRETVSREIFSSTDRPGRLYREPDRWLTPLHTRESDTIESVLVSDPALYQRIRTRFSALADRVRLDRDDPPAFERLGIEEEIERLFTPRRQLPGGGALTIEETAAGTTIDVDTGTASGPDPEAVACAVNIDAAREIARYLRLARVGGLVFIDFVGMRTAQSRKAVMTALDTALAEDPVPTERTNMSRFGVVELNRERRATPLLDEIGERTTSLTPNPATAGSAILRALERESRRAPGHTLVVCCDARSAAWLEETDLDGQSPLARARETLHARIVFDVTADLEPGRWNVYSRARA
ncbi:MAG: hypothetical protein D6763_00770 [Alphaproteobacteria bacterium]|nr:MAG: hypothetical protein D6763_00770 [Alphaproteobacteria bacterium]